MKRLVLTVTVLALLTIVIVWWLKYTIGALR